MRSDTAVDISPLLHSRVDRKFYPHQSIGNSYMHSRWNYFRDSALEAQPLVDALLVFVIGESAGSSMSVPVSFPAQRKSAGFQSAEIGLLEYRRVQAEQRHSDKGRP